MNQFSKSIFLVGLIFVVQSCSDKAGFGGNAAKSSAGNQVAASAPSASASATPAPSGKPTAAGVLSFKQTPDAVTLVTTANFTVEGDRPVKTYYYSIDGAAFTTSTNPQNTLNVYVGNHTYTAKADFQDGTQSAPITYKWLVQGIMQFVPMIDTAKGANNSWILTPNQNNKVGLLITQYRYSLNSVNVNFTFNISGAGCSGAFGDGIAFGVTTKKIADIHPDAASALGFTGTGGVGVKFDTFKNADIGDPSDNFMAVIQDTGSPNLLVKSGSGLPNFKDGQDHKVQIQMESGVVSVTIDSNAIVQKFAIPGWAADQNGHLFFSASTGGACNIQTIKTFNVDYLSAFGAD